MVATSFGVRRFTHVAAPTTTQQTDAETRLMRAMLLQSAHSRSSSRCWNTRDLLFPRHLRNAFLDGSRVMH